MCEGQLDLLRDLTGGPGPGPQLNVAGYLLVSHNVLQGAPVTDHPFHDVQHQDVVRDPVEAKPHPLEDAKPKHMAEVSPGPQEDVDATARETPLVLGRCGVSSLLKLNQIRLRLVKRDRDVSQADEARG